MKLSINNLDYTRALDAVEKLTIERTLNAPSKCRFSLSLPSDGSLSVPQSMQPLSVATDDGDEFFTGYVAGTPLPAYAGLATEGPRARLLIEAVSDEILLDTLSPVNSKGTAGMSAGALVANLAARTGSAALSTSGLTLNSPVAEFVSEPGACFSRSAAQVAQQARASYHATNGALSLSAIPGAVHQLCEGAGTLAPASLALTIGARRAMANDITVCGEHEPAAYVTEFFQGDGVTTQFELGAAPYFPPSAQTKLIDDAFNAPSLDGRVWNGATDAHLAIGDAGLQMKGGAGIDGMTQLAWRDPAEMGGTLLLEADGVTLAAGSTGVLAAFYSGGTTTASCVAGFQIAAAQGTGALTLQPLVEGVAAGTPFALDQSTQYTLRLRIHCDEQQRIRNTYISCGDSGTGSTGGDVVQASASVLFEVQPCVNGVLGMPVVLYDGAVVATLPPACTVVAASSLNLQGSMRALRLTSLGSAWVTSTPQGGSVRTRRLGAVTQSAECSVSRSGKLTFHAGFVPGVGEQIAVRYRSTDRTTGRAATSGTATASWIGTVMQPRARSSADCRNAAAALLAAASSASALWCGTYKTTQFELDADVWPGDALAINAPSCGIQAQVVVRAVKLTVHTCVPDCIEYAISFANDWAEDLAVKTSATVPADAWLPAKANVVFAPNLNAMTASVSSSAIVLAMNVAPPTNGGFEVRRRDGAFVPGNDPGLVARGAKQQFTIARSAAQERYFVRMFDGAAPPNYSEFSAAVFVNMPMSQ